MSSTHLNNLLTKAEWRKLILQRLYASSTVYLAKTREDILKLFLNYTDDNTNPAIDSLIADNYLEKFDIRNGKEFFLINFDKRFEILQELFGTGNTSSVPNPNNGVFEQDIAIPLHEETRKYNLREKPEFTTPSNIAFPNHGTYYVYVKRDDPTFYVVFIKTKISSHPTVLILGSLSNPASRLARIYHACQIASLDSDMFHKQKIEILEPKACGNNRQHSKAALEILCNLELLKIAGRQKRSLYYKLAGSKPKFITLDEFMPDTIERDSITAK
jgi:hypothetical protein